MDAKETEFKFEYEPIGGDGKVHLMLRLNGETIDSDNVDVRSSISRQRFANRLTKNFPALKERGNEIDRELLAIVDRLSAEKPKPQHCDVSDSAAHQAAKLLADMPDDIKADAESILADPMLIKTVIDDVEALGVAGECELIVSSYLIGTSRLLDRPLASIVQGPTSSGKSFVVDQVAKLFPPETIIRATKLTPQALFHMKPRSLVHKFIVAGERSRLENDETAEATRALREMLSAGKLSKLMPIKARGGQIETVLIEQDGPIAYIETTTLTKLFDEDANRCILLHTDEQTDQTRRIVAKIAKGYSGAPIGRDIERVMLRHHAIQRMLKPHPVVIPYANQLAELFASNRVEVRRAFPQLMSMIQTITLLYQWQRVTNSHGQLVAVAEDYQLARHLLVNPMLCVLGGKVSRPAQRFHDRITARFCGKNFTVRELISDENVGDRAIRGWLTEMYDANMVSLVEPSRGRSPAIWKLVASASDASGRDCPDLPSLENVFPYIDFQFSDNAQTPDNSRVMPEPLCFSGNADNGLSDMPENSASSGESL